jgi:hypothetical protein
VKTTASLRNPIRPRIVGRTTELDRLLALADPTSRERVHFLHGIGGTGKSTLLDAFALAASELGAAVHRIDCRRVEPTEAGFLSELRAVLGLQFETLAQATAQLSARDRISIIVLDTYEVFRLLDTWLRQVFVPALPEKVRMVMAGRDAPAFAWSTEPDSGATFSSVRLQALAPVEAFDLLLVRGVGEQHIDRIARFAKGHALTLVLAAAAVKEQPAIDFEAIAAHRVIEELTQFFLDGIEDPDERDALMASSVVRRVTVSLLRAMLPGRDSTKIWEQLVRLPFVEPSIDGLLLHDMVRDTIAAHLKAADPQRHTELRRAAWRSLRSEVVGASRQDLWRYTADMLYLAENPIAREAFFPPGAHTHTVEPARAADRNAIIQLRESYAGSEDARLLADWWRVAPETFRVVRDPGEGFVGYFTIFSPDDVPAAAMRAQPVMQAWLRHLREDPVPKGQKVLFSHSTLVRDGEAVSPPLAAVFLDIKRLYMEMRPALRRIYVNVVDPPALDQVFRQLYFEPLPATIQVGASAQSTYVNDFGPTSIDGWLGRLVGGELGLASSILDLAARELVLDGKRAPLTKLEFGLVQHLMLNEGRAVTRSELLDEVWGYRESGGSNVVDAVVRGLRKKLGGHAGRIEAVSGVGYRYRGS